MFSSRTMAIVLVVVATLLNVILKTTFLNPYLGLALIVMVFAYDAYRTRYPVRTYQLVREVSLSSLAILGVVLWLQAIVPLTLVAFPLAGVAAFVATGFYLMSRAMEKEIRETIESQQSSS